MWINVCLGNLTYCLSSPTAIVNNFRNCTDEKRVGILSEPLVEVEERENEAVVPPQQELTTDLRAKSKSRVSEACHIFRDPFGIISYGILGYLKILWIPNPQENFDNSRHPKFTILIFFKEPSRTTKTAAVDAKPDSRDFGMQVDMPALLRELEEIRR